MVFEGVRLMAREVNKSSNVEVQRKLDNGKLFYCTYKGVSRSWLLYTQPLNST